MILPLNAKLSLFRAVVLLLAIFSKSVTAEVHDFSQDGFWVDTGNDASVTIEKETFLKPTTKYSLEVTWAYGAEPHINVFFPLPGHMQQHGGSIVEALKFNFGTIYRDMTDKPYTGNPRTPIDLPPSVRIRSWSISVDGQMVKNITEPKETKLSILQSFNSDLENHGKLSTTLSKAGIEALMTGLKIRIDVQLTDNGQTDSYIFSLGGASHAIPMAAAARGYKL